MRLKFFFLLMILIPLLLHSGGVNLYEIGSTDLGLASAGWSARAENPSTAFTNPAGMSRFSCADVELGIQPVFVHAAFDADAETNVIGKGGNSNEVIPSGGLFYVQPINERWAFGSSVVGYFGSKLHFNHNWVGRYYLTKTILQGFSFVPAVSYKVTEKLSVGLGVNVMFGIFDQKAAVNNTIDSLSDGNLKLRDTNFGFGCVVGLLYELTPCTRAGIQYLSEVKLQFRAKPHFSGLGPGLEAALAATGVLKSRVFLDVNVPQSVIFSIYHDLTPCLAIMGNLGWQQWSNFQKATITLGSSTGPSLTSIPKYKDTWHGAIGAKYHYSDHLAFTTGFAYDSSAINTANRRLDFPVGRQLRYGAGIEWWQNDHLLLGLQYELQWQGNLDVDVNLGILAGHVTGRYKNFYAHFINLNFQWAF